MFRKTYNERLFIYNVTTRISWSLLLFTEKVIIVLSKKNPTQLSTYLYQGLFACLTILLIKNSEDVLG